MRSKTDRLQILNKARHLSLYTKRLVAKFDRSYKYLEGGGIIQLLNEIKDLILDANNSVDKKEAARIIYEMLGCLDKLEERANDAMDLNLMSLKQKANVDMYLDDIRQDAFKWRKYFLHMGGISAVDMTDGESR